MDESEVRDWAMLVRTNDCSGVLARISLLCHRLGVNLDFVRFDAEPSRVASGILVFRAARGVGDKLAGKIRGLVDVISVQARILDPTEITETMTADMADSYSSLLREPGEWI